MNNRFATGALNRQNSNNEISYWNALNLVQSHITTTAPNLFDGDVATESLAVQKQKKDKLRNMLSRFISSNNIRVEGYTKDKTDTLRLIEDLYNDMAEYSILTDYIRDLENNIEEINVNAWNDIQVIYSDGTVKKVRHFCNQEHAENTMKRIANAAGALIDEAMPMAEASISNNTRIVVLNEPIVDEDVGVACSIRLLKPQFSSRDFFIQNGTVTDEEMTFLELAIRTGVSMVFVGATSSGKTTLMNYLLSTIPDSKRIVTIEHNARELSLVKKDKDGNIINNVVHTQTRPHEKKDLDISQEDLVVKALRLDPSVICVGEMRDSEAYAAQEASLTGHTVVTSLHADGVSRTHYRIAMLALKKYEMDINVELIQAAMAFPVIVYLSKLEDNSRHVMQISECVIKEENHTMEREYHTLYECVVKKNTVVDGKTKIETEHRKGDLISGDLWKTMMINGASEEDFASIGVK